MEDKFKRIKLLFGEEKIESLKNKNIVILGIGGVGGYVCEALIRSGIQNITIIDNDIVDITNINRQIIALENTVGLKKVDIMKERLLNINSKANIKTIDKYIDETNYKDLFNNKIDYFIDCCDSIKTKKCIIKYCLNNNIKIISSMGTGAKIDPSKFKIIDIRKTSYDPIAKIIRKFIRDEKINKKLTVLCSDEKPIKVKEDIPSAVFVVGVAGFLIASHVIKDLINNK